GQEIGKAFPASGYDRKEAEKAVLENLHRENARIKALLARKSGIKMHSLRDELRKTIFEHFGVFREGKKMEKGMEKLFQLKNRFHDVYINNKSKEFNYALIYALELEGLFDIGETVARGAIARKESRGSHSRVDYPQRDDNNFLHHTLYRLKKGNPVLESLPVRIRKFPVKERVY
ncbi:MAG: hypothetical protein ACHQXK_05770, partial [Methanosarcina thermophila]